MSKPEHLTPAVINYIMDHLNDDPSQLALKTHGKSDLPMGFILEQIRCRQKLSAKMPEWAKHPDLYFPEALITEQCSSQKTAQYKSALISGELFVDLTGGLGVDTFFLSQSFRRGVYVEPNEERLNSVKHNFGVLNVTNVEFVCTTAEEFIAQTKEHFDLINIDPSRRVDKGKVVTIENSVPDVVGMMGEMKQKSTHILIKTSPLQDIQGAVRSLSGVSQVHVLSVQNDCKEVLYFIGGDNEELQKTAVNWSGSETQYLQSETSIHVSPVGAPQQYLYEPNSALMKAGMFGEISSKFGLSKLHVNSHLFTSSGYIEDFPGRKFRVRKVCAYHRKEVAQHLEHTKANITVRNFPENVASVRKKLKLRDGGSDYLFATTLEDERKVILVCERI